MVPLLAPQVPQDVGSWSSQTMRHREETEALHVLLKRPVEEQHRWMAAAAESNLHINGSLLVLVMCCAMSGVQVLGSLW